MELITSYPSLQFHPELQQPRVLYQPQRHSHCHKTKLADASVSALQTQEATNSPRPDNPACKKATWSIQVSHRKDVSFAGSVELR